ncbi:hypothetical protein E4T44_01879 [Aureobasidium sp. EXF-8845]|nr:hypothetical protein E4T44_01879 [Aureobasidium sp. EXF-8845]KAI4856697.1 hypothetical protein E4T45_01835 [Aureobasidium sp. EXF-8846]
MSGGYDVDYDSDCDVYDYDDDYIYADAGAYDLADELASGAIAEAPALYYRDDELEEYDNYNFWSEIEYGNGEIFDQDTNPQLQTTKGGNKTKSKTEDIKDTIKKIRLRGIQDYPSVLWKSSQEAFSLRQHCPVYDKPQQPTALLPNWRQLLKDRPAVFTTSYMAIHSAKDDKEVEKEDAGWEDLSEDNGGSDQDDDIDEEEDEDQDGEDEDVGLQNIDPEMLKSALAARLSASGMTGKDQTVMMEAMMQMLAGGGGAGIEDLLESLTSNMVNQVTEEGGNSSMGQWLSGQGVLLEEENDEDEDDDEEEGKEDTKRTSEDVTIGASQDSSPKDSVAADLPAAPKSSEPSIEALLEPPSTGKKRKHPLSEEIKQDDETSESSPQPGPVHKRNKQDVPRPSNGSTQAKAPARKPATSQSKEKSAGGKPIAKPKPSVSAKPKSEATKATKPKPPAPQAKEKIPPTDLVSKPTTRKRKAADEQVPDEKPKRQLRNFAAPTASSQSKNTDTKAPDKTTRSGRARK